LKTEKPQPEDDPELKLWKETLIKKLSENNLTPYDKSILIKMIRIQSQSDKDQVEPKLTRNQMSILRVMKDREEARNLQTKNKRDENK
jgi:hypothetical protein